MACLAHEITRRPHVSNLSSIYPESYCLFFDRIAYPYTEWVMGSYSETNGTDAVLFNSSLLSPEDSDKVSWWYNETSTDTIDCNV